MGAIIVALVLLQTYAYRKYWDAALDVRFNFNVPEAFEGENAVLKAEITNKKILPLPWLLIKFQMATGLTFHDEGEYGVGEKEKQSVFSVMGYKRVRRKLPFVCAKRGFYRLRNGKLTGSNLLHTETFTKVFTVSNALTVFPRLLDDLEEFAVALHNLDAMLLAHSLVNPDPFTFKGLREYLPTDPLRNVNFKATAVAGQLMVNIHAPTSCKRLEIILNLQHMLPMLSYEPFEQTIRLAATLAFHYIEQDVQVGLYTNGRDVQTGENTRLQGAATPVQLHAIYHALGRLGLYFEPPPIADYLETLQDKTCVYVLISAYQGDDLTHAVTEMRQRGLEVLEL